MEKEMNEIQINKLNKWRILFKLYINENDQLHVISSKLDSEADTNWLLYEHVMSWWSGGAGSGGVVGGGKIWNPLWQ